MSNEKATVKPALNVTVGGQTKSFETDISAEGLQKAITEYEERYRGATNADVLKDISTRGVSGFVAEYLMY